MNRTDRITSHHFLQRLVWSCVLIAALGAGVAQQANAHDRSYRPVDYYDARARYELPHSFPDWLRINAVFRHWYVEGQHHQRRYVSWTRLYDLYLRDRYYHKHRRQRHHASGRTAPRYFVDRRYDRDHYLSADDYRREMRRDNKHGAKKRGRNRGDRESVR